MSARPSLVEPAVILRDAAGVAANEVTLTAGQTYRYRLDVTQYDRIGLGTKWTGGTATITVYGCIDRNLVETLGVVPASNPWLVVLDDQFVTVPAGSAGADLLVLAFHGLDSIVIEVAPSVDVTAWGLRALLRRGAC